MKQGMSFLVATVCLLTGTIALAGVPAGAVIEGNYIEVRSCDVFTAACFANSEVGLTGEEAILAWDVKKGTHRGVNLEGLKVVAVIRASGTLGDTSATVYPARSILFVDSKADAAQSDALVEFAKDAAGQLLANVIRIEKSDITMSFDAKKPGFATLRAGCTEEFIKKASDENLTAWLAAIREKHGSLVSTDKTPMPLHDGGGLQINAKFVNGPAPIVFRFSTASGTKMLIDYIDVDGLALGQSP